MAGSHSRSAPCEVTVRRGELRQLGRERIRPMEPLAAPLVRLARAGRSRRLRAAAPHSRYGVSSPGAAAAHRSATARMLSGSSAADQARSATP